MKKILLIAAVSLIGVAASAQKFAHVNFQELVQLMPESDQARAVIQESQKNAQESYQEMMNEFQDKYAKYQQNVNSYTPATRRPRKMNSLRSSSASRSSARTWSRNFRSSSRN